MKNHPTNLPAQVTSFIGRERELAEVERLLTAAPRAAGGAPRLLILTGPGGCGKTRLAFQAAGGLVDEFADGVWLVELAALADPALVPQAVAAVLDVRELPDRPLTKTLADYLRPKRLLLILDNCEHLVAACARLAEVLLRACPDLRILATSREALGIAGETVWPVPSLSLPDPAAACGYPAPGPPSLERLARSEAVRLFSERAAAVLPAFALTDRNALAVAQVCRRLDGIPLAIELAAARVKVLTVEQIAVRLDDCFRVLTAGSRTALPRQQTLRAAIDWSHDLLSEPEQTLFRRLAPFAGGFTLTAAEAVCAGAGVAPDEVLDLLARLVDKSLALVEEQQASTPGVHPPEARYRLLETMRQYGQEKLRAAGEAEALGHQHARFFLRLAEEVGPNLNRPDRGAWLARLAVEHDNLRAALAWSLAEPGGETTLRLAGALWWFWFHAGYWSEGRGWLARALALVPAGPRTAARAKALFGAGVLAWAQGDHAAARAQLEESVAIWRALGERSGLAYALQFLGMELLTGDDLARARALTEESVALLRAVDDPADHFGLASALASLGIVALTQEDYASASDLLEESVARFRAAGDTWGLALPLRNLGIVAFRLGDYGRAVQLLSESLAVLRALGEKWFISRSLETLAGALALQGDHDRAARLFGVGEALRETVGASVLPFYRGDYDRGVAAVRAGLDADTLAAAWAAGRAMTLDQAIDEALRTEDLISAPQPSAPGVQPKPTQHSALSTQHSLRIFALGPVRVERDGRTLTSADWTYAKPRELLFYLLCHPPRTKEQIGLALWPDASPAQLRGSFHVTLHHLRRALGRPEWIVFAQGRYAFNRALDYWFDVESFEAALAEARRLRTVAPARAIRSLEEAGDLYRGDLLEDLATGEWHQPRRDELRRLYLEALLALGELRFATGRYAEAAAAYRRVIARDNLLEAAHRELMRCYARLGERGQAVRHYQTLVDLLRDELGSPPAPETAALFARLRRGEAI